jgi:hypothetical protein
MSTTDVFECQHPHCGYTCCPSPQQRLPTWCPVCKRKGYWRLMLPGEISKFDRQFLRRRGIRPCAPDGHLGATEES